MSLSAFSMFLLQVNLSICLLSHYILLLFGLLLPSWVFTIFMPTLRGGDKDIIYLLLLIILIEISYIWFSFYYYQIFCFIRFYFSLYVMRHCTLYIEQCSNKSASKLSLSCFHQKILVHICTHFCTQSFFSWLIHTNKE